MSNHVANPFEMSREGSVQSLQRHNDHTDTALCYPSLDQPESTACASFDTYIYQYPNANDGGENLLRQTPDLGSIDSTRLVIDEEDADWHIICRSDLDAEAGSPEDASILARFSQPMKDEGAGARYLRCARIQLEDFRAWLSWQHKQPIKIPRELPLVNVEVSQALTEAERIQCQQQLMSTLQPCPAERRHMAFMTLYCIANSMSDLTRPELITAIRIGMHLTSQSLDVINDSKRLTVLIEENISSLCNSLLLQDSGKIMLKHERMRKFITQLDLPNIKAGHSTMTKICFQQIHDLGAALIIQPWYRFRSWFSSISDWPLLRYVAKNWFLHYRMTPDRSDLDSELYHLLKDALLEQCAGEPSMLVERRIVDAGYSISQIYHLPGLEAIFRNMGARTASATSVVLGRLPTPSQWNQMVWAGHLTPMPEYQKNNEEQLTCYGREVIMDEDDACDAIIVRFESFQMNDNVAAEDESQLNSAEVAVPASTTICEAADSSKVNTVAHECSESPSFRNMWNELHDTEMNEGL
ncbi:hypothetical protein H2198_007151 [Neophaeococcomyces mojaviensis]|uniref:Uncharacterized protein n=1 Tax=Neophaeococcomyces mojaviensis TaxID=3383035 RepID=A0ACC3A119_9EURO|nr:hypothetical protein H2198_007151 [Knufia sp. JES_112]